MARRRCTYCKEGEGTTSDHIPPRSFFGNPPPRNLITVLCCETCRVRDQQDDQFIRNLFVSFRDTESHPAVVSQVAGRRDRSFTHDITQAAKLIEMVVPAEVRGPDGLPVRIAPAFRLNDPRVDRFIERVSRGVIYDAFGVAYFGASFWWKPQGPDFLLPPAVIKWKEKHVGDVFSYWVKSESAEHVFQVMMRFYRNLLILGRLEKA